MLEKLLHEIKSGKTHSIDELAVKLSTTPAMIQALLDHLQKLNLIRQYQSCGDSCSACSAKNLCNSEQSGNAHVLFYIETTDGLVI